MVRVSCFIPLMVPETVDFCAMTNTEANEKRVAIKNRFILWREELQNGNVNTKYNIKETNQLGLHALFIPGTTKSHTPTSGGHKTKTGTEAPVLDILCFFRN